MDNHLPECPCNHADERGCFLISAETDRCVDCICPQLRACEQRVYDERNEAWVKKCRASERHALDTAREAVAAMPPMEGWKTRPVGRVDLVDKWSAVAAIDALRGKP